MTNKERRFIEYWADQRKGTKKEYYITYGFGWTIVLFLCSFFLLKMFLDERSVGTMQTLYIITPLAIIVGISLTHFTYIKSEKKYNTLLKNKQP